MGRGRNTGEIVMTRRKAREEKVGEGREDYDIRQG